MSTYPEHEKLTAVSDDSQKLGEFLEWGVRHGYLDLYGNVEDVLAYYFNIDQGAIENEKRQMLDDLRTARQENTS